MDQLLINFILNLIVYIFDQWRIIGVNATPSAPQLKKIYTVLKLIFKIKMPKICIETCFEKLFQIFNKWGEGEKKSALEFGIQQ